jgi:hypothetical protein
MVGILLTSVVAATVIALADGRVRNSDKIPATAPAAATTDRKPADVLRKLSAAIRQNDAAAIDACLTDDGRNPKDSALIHALLRMNAASYRITRACSAAFGDQMRLQNFGFDLVPALHGGFEAMFDRSLEADHGEPPTTIEGDLARIRVNIPAAELGPALAMERWSGATLVFHRVDGQWKLDTDRSIHLVVQYRGRDRASDPATVQLKLTDLLTAKLNEVAGQIEGKQIDTADDVSAGVERAAQDAFKACRVDQQVMAMLPAIPG